MTPAQIVGNLRRRGILLVPSVDGRLLYRPQGALSATDRAVLTRHRDAILAIFESDPVGWRATVMAAQVTPPGATPLLLARPEAPRRPGHCYSCGDRLGSGERCRCRPCLGAAVAVLRGVR